MTLRQAQGIRNFHAFATRLTAKAEQIAQAATQNRIRRLASDADRWRTPLLLWPLFTRD